jgi:hypothetical protein
MARYAGQVGGRGGPDRALVGAAESRWVAFAFEGGVELMEFAPELSDGARASASTRAPAAREANGPRTVH